MILSLLGLMVCCSSVCRSKEPAKRSAFAQRGCSESRDVRVPNTNGERRMSRQTMFAAPGHVDDAPLATASRVVDTCSAPAVSCAAPAAVTLAKTSHWRSRWIHRASACSTTRFSAAQALYLAPEPVVGFVSCAASEKVVLELPSCKPGEPVLSSSISKFRIVMPGKAQTEIDNTPHAEANAGTTSGVG